MEMIDVYDENRNKTGLTVPRKSRLEKGQYMLYVLALIEDKDHKFLVTRRALDKKWAAGWWEIPGGGVLAGEASYEAVCREVKEETGLSVEGCAPEVFYSYKSTDECLSSFYFVDIYRCRVDFSLEDLQLQKAEVLEAGMASFEEMKALKEKNGFLHFERLGEAFACHLES